MTATALVPVFTGTIADRAIQLCDARTLHTFMQVKRDFTTWIKGRIQKFGFMLGEDYTLISRSPELGSGNRGASTDYHLTLDMAKELAMVENNAQGRAARRYFIECERKAMEAAQAQPQQMRLDYDRISPAQAQDLKEIVAAIVAAKVQTYGETWARLQKKFRVNSYLELPATQHLEARAYLLAKLPKGDADGTIQEAPAPKPPFDPLNAQAMVAASKQANEYFDAARQGKFVQPAAFPPEVLCGLLAQAMMAQRMLVSFDSCSGRMNIKPVPDDAYILSWSQFARGVVTNDIDPSNAELAELAAACNRRLAQRLAA